MSELKYRINSVTSQHVRYPAGNLAVSQEGWQSAINCQYPQVITIQFYVPIRTKKLHLLFHNYKIPRLIEVFVKLGARAKYRKLGYVTPNDNVQSSFEEREEKTLYFQFSCTHIRLFFHENYKNDRNVFNQVALDDLIVFGEILPYKEIEGIDLAEEESSEDEVTESVQVAHNARMEQSLPEEGQSDTLFLPIYAKLQSEKVGAVEREDYQRAAHLKKILSNFKQLEQEILKLQREKQEALRREDYDRCHRIKSEIAKKRQVVESQRQQLFKNQDNFYSQNSFIAVERQAPPMLHQPKPEPMSPKAAAQFRSPQGEKKFGGVNRHDEQVVPALLNKGGPKSSESLPLETNEKRRQFGDINQSIIPEVPNDDIASIKKDLNELRQLGDNSNAAEVSMSSEVKPIELQPLENKLRLRVQTYFSFIPERIWQLCESKNWRGKQQALRFIRERVEGITTKEEFMGTIELVSRIMAAKQAAISLQVIHLLNKLADIRIRFTLQHLPFFVEEILHELLNFLNDTNRQIKELAYTTYLKLPAISFLGLSIVARELTKHKSKVKNDPKLIITKLQLMGALLERHSQQEFPHKDTVNWILSYFEDPNQKVRTQAAELLVTLTYLIGNEKVLKLIENNRPQMMESVLNMMNSSVDYSKMQQQHSKLSLENSKLHQEFYGPEQGRQAAKPEAPAASSEKPIFLLEREQKGAKMEQSNRSRQNPVELSYSKESIFESSDPSKLQSNDDEEIRVYDEYPYQQSGPCSYCGEQFADEREHYINDCRVLVFCEKCNGYIYIREFTHHLLAQCEHAHMFTQCKKCGVALELDDSNEHVGRDTCKNKKGVNWERCQFCSEDIFAEDKFWIKHAQECRQLPARPHYEEEDEAQ